jgi:hypothetical protein
LLPTPIGIMAEKTYTLNAVSNTPVDFAVFAKDHQAILTYMSQFGTIVEKAKANVLLKLGSGGQL